MKDILDGSIPYTLDQKNRLYTASKGEFNLDREELTTNERVYLGAYAVVDNDYGMTPEMTACQMTKEYSQQSECWELEYIQRGDCIDIYGRYRADYRFEYNEHGYFVIKDCHNNSTVKYDVPFYETYNMITMIKQNNKDARIDATSGYQWEIVCKSDGKAGFFTPDLYNEYRNLWYASVVNSKMSCVPVLAEKKDENNNTIINYDKNYITPQRVQWIYAEIRKGRMLSEPKPNGERKLHNPKRESSYIRGYSPHQQGHRQA